MNQELDEYPSVPFFREEGQHWQYDSSALGHWLDDRSDDETPPLYPVAPRLNFVARLVDEAFDEYGLYMVHHQRWVSSALDTSMGEVTAAEMSPLVTPLLAPLLARQIPRRQARRCPYLFSVAAPGYSVAGLEPRRIPPGRAGFPPTHELLNKSWLTTLAAMESLLEQQPWILGDRFSIADASVYGQLSINLIDPSAERELRERAPRTRAWLEDIRDGKHVQSRGELYLSPAVKPLLAIIDATFVPLMVQNEQAWKTARENGEYLFNERAFDADRSLYDGELMGYPFRAVVKTFQIRVWQDICGAWQQLDTVDKQAVAEYLSDETRVKALCAGS